MDVIAWAGLTLIKFFNTNSWKQQQIVCTLELHFDNILKSMSWKSMYWFNHLLNENLWMRLE